MFQKIYFVSQVPSKNKNETKNVMDLDQAAMERQLALGTAEGHATAKDIYNNGGHSKSHARITLTPPGLTKKLSKGDAITGIAVDGTTIDAKAYSGADIGSTTVLVQYKTLDTQENHVMCKVGALPIAEQIHEGCLER